MAGNDVIFGLGMAVAVGAAARSTWSPCGLSMLSSITPFGERSRGHRYGVTAAWFVIGATIGGATLGAAAALLAGGASGIGLSAHPAVVAVVAVAGALLAASVDTGAFGDWLPLFRRQVDDAWLARYRSWVYGAGFGWQIGVGVATYIMTAAVFLIVLLGALTTSPVEALVVCTAFGVARGLAVLLTSRAGSPDRLRVLHRRLERVREPVRWTVIGAEAVVAVVAAVAVGAGWPVAGAAVATGLVAAMVATETRRRRARRRDLAWPGTS